MNVLGEVPTEFSPIYRFFLLGFGKGLVLYLTYDIIVDWPGCSVIVRSIGVADFKLVWRKYLTYYGNADGLCHGSNDFVMVGRWGREGPAPGYVKFRSLKVQFSPSYSPIHHQSIFHFPISHIKNTN